MNLIKFGYFYIYSDNQTCPTTAPEQFRRAAQQEERDRRAMGSPERRRIPDQSLPPAPVYVPPPPPPAPGPIATMSYNNLPPDLAQRLANLPDFPKPGRRGRPRKNIHAPALASAPAFAPAFAPALAPPIVPAPPIAPATPIAPAPSLGPAPLTIQQLAAQCAALPDLVQPARRGRPRITVPAPAPLSFAQLAAQYAALQPVCVFCYICISKIK